MGSVPGRHAGLGSAINNALSRVGQPLLGSIVFIVVSATFYGQLAGGAVGVDTSIDSVRQAFPPLNPPAPGTTPEQVAAANAASIAAFHGAMIGAAILLVVGAVVDWIGLRPTAGAASGASPATDGGLPDTGPA